MTDPGAVARAHYRAQSKLVQDVSAAARRTALGLDPGEVSRAWAAGPRARTLALVTAAQRQAAEQGGEYVGRILSALGVHSDAAGELDPGALAGVASDGRPLPSLLDIPALRATKLIGDGASADEAVAQMARQLVMIAATQVADAGRIGTGVAQTVERRVIGWVRVVQLPACSRCIVLADVLYTWSDGFQRHPLCDCIHRPVATQRERDATRQTNPAMRMFDQLSADEQTRIFGEAGAKAIRDGADLAKVVNARRGMRTSASGRRTPVTNRRARGGARLMPEDIYRQAGDDRDQAIRLLRRFGFIV